MKIRHCFIRSIIGICVWGLAIRGLANPVLPKFSPANFAPGAAIDNLYYPLPPGTTYRESAHVTDPDTGAKGFQIDENSVELKTTNIAGVSARIVRARSWLDNVLIEDTLDYFAQDKSGNVWYLGEDTKAFEYDSHGHLINTDTTGSFRAGFRAQKPGFIMPANPKVGFSYYQELSKTDAALDQAKIVSLNEKLSIPLGDFSNVLQTQETSAVEPGVVEFKYYVRGFGESKVLEDIQANGKPLNTFVLYNVSTNAIPLPSAAYTGFAMTALIALYYPLMTVKRRCTLDKWR